jgi:predicted AAA+ superfamily ATPase
MWIERQIESRLKRLATQRPVIVVTGARQVGKSSLVARLFPEHSAVTLDLPSEAEQAERDPGSFLKRHAPPLIVDEVQYAPALFRHLKLRVDAARNNHGQFILTGSQKLTLMVAVAESLAGRAEILDLEGLSLSEIATAYPAKGVESLAVRGSFPELYENPQLDASGFHRSYISTYLERDLRTQLNVANLRDFERFLRACALRSAQLLNKAELARDVGISPSTANQWLSLLEASNQVFLLEPWFNNRTKSLVKTPKLYLCDTGLLCFLAGIRSVDELRNSPMAGAVFETLVCAELRKQVRLGLRAGQLFFYRDRTREVDFLIDRGGRFELFETKWTEIPDSRDAIQLQHVAEALGDGNVLSRHVVCRTPNRHPIERAVEAIDVHDLAGSWKTSVSGEPPG